MRKGYAILERNYLRPWGEIDIVAEKEGSVRFVEVKTTTGSLDGSREKGRPEELLHKTKIVKLARTASLYMESTGDQREFQIDAVAVIMDPVTRTARCTLYEQIME